ncbi:hypothetical protein AB4Y32_36960 [Paraburkholderia phymatum]|uniref:Uncharacterized protein n=1 Tax=Paraburkholderia phymatum TaxID=148447 RepID=A0ACC6UC92_9BURK
MKRVQGCSAISLSANPFPWRERLNAGYLVALACVWMQANGARCD